MFWKKIFEASHYKKRVKQNKILSYNLGQLISILLNEK